MHKYSHRSRSSVRHEEGNLCSTASIVCVKWLGEEAKFASMRWCEGRKNFILCCVWCSTAVNSHKWNRPESFFLFQHNLTLLSDSNKYKRNATTLWLTVRKFSHISTHSLLSSRLEYVCFCASIFLFPLPSKRKSFVLSRGFYMLYADRKESNFYENYVFS